MVKQPSLEPGTHLHPKFFLDQGGNGRQKGKVDSLMETARLWWVRLVESGI